LELANVIDSDAATIGARHVLGHGVSDVIAMLESELSTLDRAVAASAPMLQMITRLGAGLNAFNANAAPIAVVSGIRRPPDVTVEQLSQAMPDLTAERLNQAMPKQALIPATSRSGHYDRSRSTGRLDQAMPLASPTKPPADLALPPTQQMSRRDPVTTPHEDQTATGPTATQPLGSAIAPATSRSIEPTSNGSTLAEQPSGVPTPLVAVSIAPSVPEFVQLLQLEVGGLPPSKAPIVSPSTGTASSSPAPMTDGVAEPPATRTQRIVIGAMAPNDAPQADADIPAASVAGPSDTVRTHTKLGTAVTPQTSADPTEQPEGAPLASAAAEPPLAESGPRQGTLILDGAQLGRWMMDHLERHASRPGAMATGFDPRMNAAYPGAPAGT
jgi:hypothetical protein